MSPGQCRNPESPFAGHGTPTSRSAGARRAGAIKIITPIGADCRGWSFPLPTSAVTGRDVGVRMANRVGPSCGRVLRVDAMLVQQRPELLDLGAELLARFGQVRKARVHGYPFLLACGLLSEQLLFLVA